MITIAFFKGTDNLLDTVTRAWMRGRYSHAEVVIDDLWYTASPFEGGIRSKKNLAKPDQWDFINLIIDKKRVKKWFDDHEGRKYDYMGLFGFAIRPLTGDPKRFFCSEAIALSIGLEDAWRLDPNSLYIIVKRLAIEQGTI